MVRHHRSVYLSLCVVAGLGWSACAEDDPEKTQLDGAVEDGLHPNADAGECTPSWTLPDVNGDNPECQPAETDYQPGSADDGWDSCISDDNAYHQFEENISSIARVAAFEEIVELLLKDTPPTAQDFVDAKVAYTQQEGLDSRVSRREDEHYPEAEKACADMDETEIQANANRCVGQAQIQPLLNDAFQKGAAGEDPLIHAARVESALLWFLYVSTYKEAITCTNKQKDCDSSYAYYTGGENREGGLGLSRYVQTVSPQAHDRVWDGILAVRCWRDLDQAVPAEDLTMRDQAMAQLDQALLRGMALLVKSRVTAAQDACSPLRQALWTSAQILGGVLDREAEARDPQKAQALRQNLAQTVTATTIVPATAIANALEELFPCP